MDQKNANIKAQSSDQRKKSMPFDRYKKVNIKKTKAWRLLWE